MNGKIFVIEGVDASGKESQSKALFQRLIEDGLDVIRLSFPDYESDSSALVKMYLAGDFGKDPQAVTPYVASTFYAADRFASYTTKWKEHYAHGGIVIADRYTTANMVHQASKIDDAREKLAFLDWLWNLEYEIYAIPKPDKVFFLDMPPEISFKLMKARENKITGDQAKDIHEKDTAYLLRSYENAHFVSEHYSWNIISCVDANQSLKTIENISDEIYEQVKTYLNANA